MVRVWNAADWNEREQFDLFEVSFSRTSRFAPHHAARRLDRATRCEKITKRPSNIAVHADHARPNTLELSPFYDARPLIADGAARAEKRTNHSRARRRPDGNQMSDLIFAYELRRRDDLKHGSATSVNARRHPLHHQNRRRDHARGDSGRRLLAPIDRAHRGKVHLRRFTSLHRSRRLRLRDDRQSRVGGGGGKARPISVPPRGEYLRVITDELNRISSHAIALGAMAMDIGATTPFMYILREREYINDLLEEICGARLDIQLSPSRRSRLGHASRMVATKCKRWLDHSEPVIAEFDLLITNERIVRQATRQHGGPSPTKKRSIGDWSARICAQAASTSTCAATCHIRFTRI